MAMLAVAVPVLPGKTEQWRRFIGELTGQHKGAMDTLRRRLGVRERTFFQPSPRGDLVLVTLEGDDPAAAFAQFAADPHPSVQWFVQQVKEIHGLDLAQPPPGPLPELVYDLGAT